ncbi:unannotated protein [freshwater metagenome]|uniref:Unannotated protein n=1 Tax=freshwater metagenome TaxID=449393 RepID=A0A6J5ZEE9_9ZZZZ
MNRPPEPSATFTKKSVPEPEPENFVHVESPKAIAALLTVIAPSEAFSTEVVQSKVTLFELLHLSLGGSRLSPPVSHGNFVM